MTGMPLPAACPRLLLPLLLALAVPACGGPDPVPSGDRPIVARADNPDVAEGVEDADTPRIISVVVTDGRLTGDTGVVEVKRNVPVRLVVISDRADTLEVQGYDVTGLVTAEVPTQVEFLASKPGEFPVRLEQAGIELTRLRVR